MRRSTACVEPRRRTGPKKFRSHWRPVLARHCPLGLNFVRKSSWEHRLGKSLIIVESPAKAKTIAKYLGKDYVVESSIGHIRDLPSSADEIPAQYKKKAWARTGVDIENN